MEAALLPSIETIGTSAGISTSLATLLVIALIVWSLVFKGIGLWHAARNHQKRWFIAMLILNTAGILEIVYLVWFRADKKPGHTPSLFETPMAADAPAGSTA